MALTNEDLKAIANLLQPVKDDIHMIKDNVTTLQKDTQELKQEVQVLKQDVQVLKQDVQVLKQEVQVLKQEVQVLKQDVQKLDERVTNIELILENETNRGIKIIAEGHLDLNRKLNEALKVEDEKELLLLRVGHLESEMQSVKAQLNQSA